MNIRYFNDIIICFFLILKFESFKSAQDIFNKSKERGDEKKNFIKCLEENSITSCLILFFINERQEKLLLQIQNELSK